MYLVREMLVKGFVCSKAKCYFLWRIDGLVDCCRDRVIYEVPLLVVNSCFGVRIK